MKKEEKEAIKKYKFNKCQNMLLGRAFGDAFGVGFELLMNRKKVRRKFQFDYYYIGGSGWKRGQYSDDTQMSMAVAELLISKKEFNELNLANKFVEVYRRDPHFGYGSIRYNLKKAKNGAELLKTVRGNSWGNGACMRATPIGILSNLKKAVQYAKINAKVTHNSPSAIASSVCIATATHYFYYNLGKPEKVFNYCINACRGIDGESIKYFEAVRDMKKFDSALLFGEKNKECGVPVNGMRTAGAVLYIISRFYKNPSETLKEAVLLGGDTDTTASMCLGIIAMKTGINKLPTFLFRDLENKRYGRDYLIELGGKLELFSKNFGKKFEGGR